jgi:hypothetical protein
LDTFYAAVEVDPIDGGGLEARTATPTILSHATEIRTGTATVEVIISDSRIAHDPRGFGVISPADIVVSLSHSKRAKEKRFYRKVP